jgi:ABC-2 type transport system permease protein
MFLSDGMDSYLVDSINELYKNIQIKKLNLSNEVLKTINIPFTVSYDEIDSVDGNPFALMALSILLFYAIYFCAYQVSSSITTEKTSKIIETLVTSTSPNNIVIGKTLGIGLVGLLQIILYMLTAFISAKLFMDKELITALTSSTNISFGLALITLLYFILGYFAFAFLYALTGSTVAKPEDIQSANSPVAILSVFGFYLAYFTMMNPTSNLNYFASLFPLSSPFCVPFRIMMGISTFKDVILSLLILVITIIIVARITIRIYKNAILNYGSKMNFKDIINMYKQK